jgi:hypothetical protein
LVPDILEQLEQYTKETGCKVDAVCSFVELATETAAKVAEELKLPCSPSKSVYSQHLSDLSAFLCVAGWPVYLLYNQVAIARSKPATRDCCEAAGLPKVAHYVLNRRSDIQKESDRANSVISPYALPLVHITELVP